MSELKKILNQIYELREHINSLVVQKKELIDPEVLMASEELDEQLNAYEEQMRLKTSQ